SDCTTGAMARQLVKEAQELLPGLNRRDVITSYAGLRPKTVSSAVGGFNDFTIEELPELPGMMHLVGIESPGLTAAPAIALDIAKWVGTHLPLRSNSAFHPERKAAVPFNELPAEQQAELVEADPDYGQVICRCESVTRKEILEAIHNPLGAQTIGAIKYRSRATMGRCQGGFCGPNIEKIMEEELGVPPTEMSLKGDGSWLFTGSTKDLRN
ncbi:MAG: FAD-dependent oxidoreductase, partial [Betaproteobacteria bacterium]|nr:FAD-dependent oxidoreductase [Betaproteobacteria bacterium]